MNKSFVQVYTGEGKGKTTAAVGLAVRAAGQGLCVKFVQFLKAGDSGEVAILRSIPEIEWLQAAGCSEFFAQLSDAQKAALRKDAQYALTRILGWLDKADLLIMDEALGALYCGVLELNEIIHIIEKRGRTEIVLTGRNAPDAVLQRADLVTQMQKVKHYYDAGNGARRGIEY